MRNRFVILGCGFTGSRVLRRLRGRGFEAQCAGRSAELAFDAAEPAAYGNLRQAITRETVVLYSIPTLRTAEGRLFEATPRIVEALAEAPAARVVYLSTTGVYGPARVVDERTLPAPETERERLRVEAERAVAAGPWSSLILRPAAIYGPGRGMPASMRAGKFRLAGSGENFVSRIHVNDLAAITEAALLSDLIGAYPVADAEPSTSRAAAEYCAKLLGLPLPPSADAVELGETRGSDRRTDGSAIRNLLGVELQYPSYREGFKMCVMEEDRAFSMS